MLNKNNKLLILYCVVILLIFLVINYMIPSYNLFIRTINNVNTVLFDDNIINPKTYKGDVVNNPYGEFCFVQGEPILGKCKDDKGSNIIIQNYSPTEGVDHELDTILIDRTTLTIKQSYLDKSNLSIIYTIDQEKDKKRLINQQLVVDYQGEDKDKEVVVNKVKNNILKKMEEKTMLSSNFYGIIDTKYINGNETKIKRFSVVNLKELIKYD